MKTHLLRVFALLTVLLLFLPAFTFAQQPMITLGVAKDYVLFGSAGPLTSTNSSALPKLTGNIGTNGSTVSSGFGNIDGQIHDNDGTAGSAPTAAAVLAASLEVDNINVANYIAHAVGLGSGETLTPGVYFMGTGGAATLGGDLTLTGTGAFVFVIDGSLSITGSANVILAGGATACNVLWRSNGVISMAAGANVKGTFLAKSGAINMTGATLEGRALAVTGAISLNGSTARIPIGCPSPNLSPTLLGPASPTLGYTACFVLFTTTGTMINSNAAATFTGSIGSNSVSPSGFNPANITGGIIFNPPSPTTASAASDLGNLYSYLLGLSTDINLVYPQQLGNDLVLTPHTYNMAAAALLTGNLYLNAQGNANAVFVIKVAGALTTATGAAIILQNQAQSKNVFWEITGAVSIAGGSTFRGTIVGTAGIDLGTTVTLDGSGLTTSGAVSTSAGSAIKASTCTLTGTPSVSDGKDEVVILYPNPFTTSTTILFNGASQDNSFDFRIYNVIGKEVMNTKITGEVTTISTLNLPAGIYFYKMIGKNNVVKSGKLISQQ